MPSFSGLNIAMSGLRAQQYALDTTANNIANANTDGFHRQEVVFVPGNPLRGMSDGGSMGSPQIGTGVMVQSVRRMQSTYVDNQVRMANQWIGNWQYKDDTLKQVESVLSEPSDIGISGALNKFWSSWETLAADKSASIASKVSVVESGAALANQIKELNRSLRDLQTRTDQDIADNASQVNRIAHEIANCNEQIRKSVAGGYEPNDMLDRRDLLLDDLSKIVHVDVSGMTGAELTVTVSGKLLVQGDQVNEMKPAVGAQGKIELRWDADNTPVETDGGALAGQIETRDVYIEDYLQSLDTLAREIVDGVNAIHSTGVLPDGSPAGNFFVAGGYSANMQIEPDILNSNTAAGLAVQSSSNATVTNDLAQDISKLRNSKIADDYGALVARIGAQSRESKSRVDLYTDSLQQLETQRQSVSGVSVDDEMLNMVKFQQGYNASARVFQVMDEMIDTIINKLGI